MIIGIPTFLTVLAVGLWMSTFPLILLSYRRSARAESAPAAAGGSDRR